MESEAIRAIASSCPMVIATGGGAVLNSTNVARLRRNGIVILLWADPGEIAARVRNKTHRPLLADSVDRDEKIRELMVARDPLYRAAAHVVVDTTGLSRAETVER